VKGVLFLCVANSARSQLAEGLARRLAPPGVNVLSAGSDAAGVNPLAIAALAEIGIDASGQTSKRVSTVDLSQVDTIVTLCAEEVCPVVPRGYRQFHWPLPDPTAVPPDERMDAFRRTRDEIARRLEGFFHQQQPGAHDSPGAQQA
jgi:thioredoxin type arsenate reductase